MNQKKKVSGSKYIPSRKKRLCDLGGDIALTNIAQKRLRIKRVKGANIKVSLLSDEYVFVSKDSKVEKLKILGVINNPANVNYTRRNIITKSCLVKTEKGDVKITSRPGQNGILQGVFI
ncbi:30S ribosomal protein S8e [bacterium]|nr:30S ribosomal protein S8e [bacterium]